MTFKEGHMRKNFYTTNLTALIAIAASSKRRMEAEGGGKPEDKPNSGGSSKREMTAEQYEQQRRAELAKETLESMINRVIKLEADNYDLRRKAAPEGGVVLDANERKQWEALKALGEPDKLKAKLEQAEKDRKFVEQQERRAELEKVAAAAGFDADTFADLDGLAGGLEYRVQEVKDKETGDTIQQAQVKAGDSWDNLEDFAGERWKKFLPVLQAGEGEQDKSSDGGADKEVARRVPTGGAGGGRSKPYTVEEAEKAKAESGQYVM